jgi:hypothetical protein
MNGSIRALVVSAFLLPALLLVASSGVLLAQEEQTIVGAWLLSSDTSPNSKVVVLYHRDGTLIHFAGGPTSDGSYQNPAGGVWRNGTGRSYHGTGIYTYYIPGTSTMLYMIKASATWTVSQDGDHAALAASAPVLCSLPENPFGGAASAVSVELFIFAY